MQYDHIIALIRAWESYEKQGGDSNLEAFARWMLQQPAAPQLTTSPVATRPEGYERVNTDVLLNILLHRINRQWEIQTKEIFAALPEVTSLSELRILSCVAGKNQPKKNEVISEVMLETTTGTMLMQRMVARGLLTESADPVDRRAVRLALTEKGGAALASVVQQLSPMMTAFFAPLSDEEKVRMAGWLGRL